MKMLTTATAPRNVRVGDLVRKGGVVCIVVGKKFRVIEYAHNNVDDWYDIEYVTSTGCFCSEELRPFWTVNVYTDC